MNRPCSKIKNPCKICCDTVNRKTGIQCHGACQRWAHFKCLNYTPGKIEDIKAGLIKINCPCPDCNNADAKKNACKSIDCPIKKQSNRINTPKESPEAAKPIPTYAPVNQRPMESKSSCFKPQCPKCTRPSNNKNSHSTSPCLSLDSVEKAKFQCPKKKAPVKQSYSHCVITKSCSDININCIPSQCASSDSKLSRSSDINQKDLYVAIEKMCATVGHLSKQMRDLLCKIKEPSQ